MISKQINHVANEGNQSSDVRLDVHQEVGESQPKVNEFLQRNDASTTEADEEDNCLFRLPSKQHTRILSMCVEYPQVCETCIERYANLKYKLRRRFLEGCLPVEKDSTYLDTVNEITEEVFDLFGVEPQSQNEYWCDIDGVRVKYTQKEYERQMLQKKPVETKIYKPKKMSKKKTSSMLSRLSKAKVHVQSSEEIVIPSSHFVEFIDGMRYTFEARVQSSEEIAMESVDDAGGISSSQNVEFVDQNAGTIVTIDEMSDSTMTGDAQIGIELGDFLKRPVLINSYTWSESTNPGYISSFKPWHLYFNTTSIKKKLDNYAYIHCNLCVKIVVNASPFYYGSMYYAYNPLAGLRSETITRTGDTGLNYLIPYSQRPGIWVLPQISQGGVMTLPFTYHKNVLDITSSSDIQNMGTIDYMIVNQLTSANGATGTGVTVQIYAWCENVQLMNSTVKLALQSQDEYGGGAISAPASAVATALGSLESVPIIGKYMRASSMIASTVGSVAKLFGFTNVPNIDTVHYNKICAFPQFATSEISTPIEKLTLDPKNELSIDPRIVGIPPNDELAISYLAGKESYIGSTTIATTDAVDAMVFCSLVKPKMHGYTAGAPVAYQCTPMSYLQQTFKYWRGDIIYRFRFICTKFHKGRMRITYDPLGDIGVTADNYSTSFNVVVDYGEEQDIEIRVPYSQNLPWLKTDGDLSVIDFSLNNTTHTHVAGSDNGVLTLRVVTPLSAPLATASLGVQVFVRAADNFEVALPSDVLGFTHLTVQSQDEVSIGETTTVIAGNAIGTSHPERYHINMGENIKSFRQVLRRTMFSEALMSGDQSSYFFSLTSHRHTKYPRPPGFISAGYYLANKTLVAGTAPFNFSRMTHYNWIAPCFVAQRGSMMWNVNVDTNGTGRLINDLSITRYGTTIVAGDWNSTSGVASGTANAYVDFARANNTTLQGTSLTNQSTQTALGVLYPNYNQFRFQLTDPYYINLGTSIDGSDVDTFTLRVRSSPLAGAGSNNYVIKKYCSIGPDFSLMFWINVPTIFYMNEPTPA